MKPARRQPGRPPGRGAVTLALVMMLVMSAALAALYTNRSVLVEQRSAANQWQSMLAREAAEAGMEWALGMLNTPQDIDGECRLQASAQRSFRLRYVLTRARDPGAPSTEVAPAANVFPSCKLGAAGPQCACPEPPAAGESAPAPALGNEPRPGFSVAFDAVAGDPEAVQVTAWGCAPQAAACSPRAAGGEAAPARMVAVYKLRPMLRAMPAAPLTCGAQCQVGGSYEITNRDVATNGILVNAGAGITTANGVGLNTLPGQPSANALVGNDPSLAALSSADADCSQARMFNAYFGSTLEQFRSAAGTKELSCGSAADCNGQLQAAYDAGWRSFYFASDLHLSGNQRYGSATDPIAIVTPHAIDVNGDSEFWGLIFSNSAAWNDLGTGSARLHGAQVACAGYRNNGNGDLSYEADTLTHLRRLTGLMARVPGSWRDFRHADDGRP